MNRRLHALCALLVLPLGACDAQTDGGYEGEILLTMSGIIQGADTAPPEGVDLVIAYLVQPTEPNAPYCIFDAAAAIKAGLAPDLGCQFANLAPERLEVKGEFPSAFRFELTHPPSPASRFTDNFGNRSAVGQLFAVRAGSAGDGKIALGDLIGYSDYGLAYAGGDFLGTDVCHQAQDGTLTCGDEVITAGFHVLKNTCTAPVVPQGTICSAIADGETITVQLADLATIVDKSIVEYAPPSS